MDEPEYEDQKDNDISEDHDNDLDIIVCGGNDIDAEDVINQLNPLLDGFINANLRPTMYIPWRFEKEIYIHDDNGGLSPFNLRALRDPEGAKRNLKESFKRDISLADRDVVPAVDYLARVRGDLIAKRVPIPDDIGGFNLGNVEPVHLMLIHDVIESERKMLIAFPGHVHDSYDTKNLISRCFFMGIPVLVYSNGHMEQYTGPSMRKANGGIYD